jgi:hypothetical protein
MVTGNHPQQAERHNGYGQDGLTERCNDSKNDCYGAQFRFGNLLIFLPRNSIPRKTISVKIDLPVST